MRRTVEDVMTARVVVAKPSTSFRDLLGLLRGNRITAVPVVDASRRVLGVVSEGDLLLKEGYPTGTLDAPPLDVLRSHRKLDKGKGIRASDLMTTPAVTVPITATVAEAARIASRNKLKRLPVVDANRRLVGIVTRGDLLTVFLRPDLDIQADVLDEIALAVPEVTERPIRVNVRDCIVTLGGELERRAQVVVAVRAAQRVEGVAEVRSDLSWRVGDETAPRATHRPQ